jgi:hypothetical protein
MRHSDLARTFIDLPQRAAIQSERLTNASLTGLDLSVDLVGRKRAEPGQKIGNQIRLSNCNSVFDSSRTGMGWVVMGESLLLERT